MPPPATNGSSWRVPVQLLASWHGEQGGVACMLRLSLHQAVCWLCPGVSRHVQACPGVGTMPMHGHSEEACSYKGFVHVS